MKKERLFYLDFVRAIAVICVFVVHYTRQLEYDGVGFVNKILPDYIFNVYLGSYGVSLFFIISGAALMFVYQEQCKLSQYLKKRFWSIYPMFWIAYTCAFLYNFYMNRGFGYEYPKSRIILTLLGMDGYLGWFFPNFYLLGEWFLGCLIFLYILFPALRKAMLKWPVFTAICAAAIYFVVSFSLQTPMPLECFFILRVPELLFGMYFMRYIKKIPWTLVAGSLLTLLYFGISDMSGIKPIYVTPPVGMASFILIAFAAKYVDCKLTRLFCGVISKYSYAIFLSHHFIIQKVVPRFNGRMLSRSENYFLFIICVGITAFVSYWLLKWNDKICEQSKRLLERKTSKQEAG